MIEFPYSIAGFAVGAIVGLTGVGGGSLMTPILMLIFGVSPATAVGTDLLFAGITKSAGAISHARSGHVDWKVAGLLAAGSFPGTLVALALLALFPASSHSMAHLISGVLGVMLVLTALSLVLRTQLLTWASALSKHVGEGSHRTWLTVAVGAFIGIAVTLSSVGAGALGVAALLLLHPRLPTVRIVGTDIAHAVPIVLVAGAGHAWLGHIDWRMLASLLVGSIPGILLGAWFASRAPERLVRNSLALMLVFAGGKLIL
jgi:uncharacterized membrane protein YfcA